MLFVQSITYNLTHGDDTTCQGFQTEVECLKERSAFDSQVSKCYWSIDTETDVSSCRFVQPDSDITVVIFVAILSAVISTPFAMATDWMIQSVLAAPLRSNGSISIGAHDIERDGLRKLSSIIPLSDNGNTVVLRNRRPRSVLSALPGAIGDVSGIASQCAIQAEHEFSTMVTNLQNYRKKLITQGQDIEEFDSKCDFVSI
jgi:hypothetical protein